MKWKEFIINQTKQDYLRNIIQKVNTIENHQVVYPLKKQRFRCFNFFDIEQTKVVILGQDPYHTPKMANGLCFSVDLGNNLPGSLVNIFKALEYDLQIKRTNPDLSDWAKQGVLLLNTVLTVNAHQANSHKDFGYDQLIKNAFIELKKQKHVVYLLWGKQAMSYIDLIDKDHNLILCSPSFTTKRASWFFNLQAF
nr:uracil-DNA glycosylase [Ureaplasma urealyticum]